MSETETLEAETNLTNWRTHPFCRWSFHHVDHLLHGHLIAAPTQRGPVEQAGALDLASLALPSGQSVAEALESAYSDAFLVLHRGRIVHESYDGLMAPEDRHIIFSVSKSVTGALAGILVEEGRLDPERPVTDYIPELANSAWGDATVRHVLDMVVSIRFIEDYLDPQGDVSRYRVAMDWNPPGNFPYVGGLHSFLPTLPKDSGPHGAAFHYVSPNSDVLGWILERASGCKFADLLSDRIWRPLGAEADAWITVDREGGSRTAGGICTRARDLARFGEMMRNKGRANGLQIVPESWIKDILQNGDRQAWSRGSGLDGLVPTGSYRNQWYLSDAHPGAMIAIGIHGQWIYVDPRHEVTIIKLSSQPLPEDEALDTIMLDMFRTIAGHLSETSS
ncbi:serine hydrolase domain-containing protein [Aliiruegeria sabulilitoris]|uniref:serine hydrolase domain-containing protein n=1 Tax=Aliiruegeria sabulilitoris TaxID=1510458 RepID=UPI00082B3DBD|nr:serine hydrolase [Aliiruegeria sabulilitoris]NDR56293.1 serine hydrolase [Pseudoruegeria sp. M32A2M]